MRNDSVKIEPLTDMQVRKAKPGDKVQNSTILAASIWQLRVAVANGGG